TSNSTTSAAASHTTLTANDLSKTELRATLPQQLQLQQQNSDGTTFVFTSPTSTFKRKKQQQLLREEEEQLLNKQQHDELLLHNNNLTKGVYAEGLIGSSESATNFNEDYNKGSHSNTSLLRHWNQEQQQQHQPPPIRYQRYNKPNDTKTVINTSTGVIITDNAGVNYASSSTSSLIAGGNGTIAENVNGSALSTRSTRRIHTLPLLPATKAATTTAGHSKLQQQLPTSFIADGVVDLVHDTKCAAGKTSTSLLSSSSPPTAHPASSKINSKSLNSTTASSKRNRTSANNLRHKQQLSSTMQASSSGGSGTTTTAKGFSNTSSLVDDIEMNLGLIGWRKKCLYTLLVLLMLLIIVNLGLTLWILKVMEFSTEGMGQLKIVPGGIQLTGQALIMDMLRASSIRSRHGQPLSIETSRNFSINTRGVDGLLENHLFLGHDKLECMATSFRINDTNGRNLFSVNRDEVTIGAHALRVDGEGGAIFRESIQTPHVRAEPGRELRLESPTRQLEMKAAQEINLQSRAGGIEISALEDIKLTTIEGSLRFESSKIFMPNLRTVPSIQGQPQKDHTHRVFQLCACSSGKLFLASSHSSCAGDDSTVCR
ncbi:uncharacterized protein LOC133334061, partial [Musca vetustissima]|uniref:uncharacterized protein LOC133334061 n=1 Tax=Musca vetustissima TaxID=27455 RepID=UPI002AB6D24B